jgi:hypothetical protein
MPEALAMLSVLWKGRPVDRLADHEVRSALADAVRELALARQGTSSDAVQTILVAGFLAGAAATLAALCLARALI